MVERVGGKSGENRAERLEHNAEVEVSESGINYVLRMVVVEILNSVKGELKKMKEDDYSLVERLQLAQKELASVRGELKEKVFLLESLRKAAGVKKGSRRGQKRRTEQVSKPRRSETCVQEWF